MLKKVDDGTTTEALRIGSTSSSLEDDDNGTVGWGPFGQNDAVNYFNGWNFALCIRPNFDQSLSVNELTKSIYVNIFPNPSNGLVNINVEGNLTNTIVVTDLAGKVVTTKTANGNTTIDLASFGSGVYMVKVSNDKGTSTERVVIK